MGYHYITRPEFVKIGNYLYSYNAETLIIDVTYVGDEEHITEAPLTIYDDYYYIVSLSNCFSGNTKIKSVDMSSWKLDKIKYIDNMFAGCTNLERVNFGKRFEDLIYARNVFANAPKLKHIENLIVSREISVFHGMFNNCDSLETLNLKYMTVKGIGNYFIDNCPNLKSIEGFKNNKPIQKYTSVLPDCVSITNLELIELPLDLKDDGICYINLHRFIPTLIQK